MNIVKTQEAQPMGTYTATPLDYKKLQADILIQYANGGSFTIKVQRSGIALGKRGVKINYGQGRYEVTDKKLKSLQQTYTVMTDF